MAKMHDGFGGRVEAAEIPDVAEQFGAGSWKFTEQVTEVFDEHVRASVPFYDEIQQMVAELSDWLVPAGGLVADLGCSTGNTDLAILARHPDRDLHFVLYDESAPMAARAGSSVRELAPGRVTAHIGQLKDELSHKAADLTLLLFVLQFMPYPDQRLAVLAAARRASALTGALIVAEKTRPADPRWAEIGIEVSHDFKARAGITDAAIRAKARALRGVLHPYTQDATMELITMAGWRSPEVLFRWHQWVLIGAWARS